MATPGSKLDNTKIGSDMGEGHTVPIPAEEISEVGADGLDPVLRAKMHLVNEAINEIGYTWYHWKLFMLNGFGYSVDSQLTLLASLTQSQVAKEFHPSYSNGLSSALFVGLFFGALFWGSTADIIGRRFAFQTSLLISAVFAIVTGGAPNWIVCGLFVSISAFGSGGNLVLDTTVFLEFLPRKQQYLVTLLAFWWGIGQTVAALVVWGFLGNYSCQSSDDCHRSNNMGWRYAWITNGVMVLLMSIARVTIIQLAESPKWLLTQGRDAELVQILHNLATKYGRSCSLKVEQLEAIGAVHVVKTKRFVDVSQFRRHVSGLFGTRKMALSTVLIWASWLVVGLAYALFNVFLPYYYAQVGASFGNGSTYETYRDEAITYTVSIVGPLIAAALCRIPRIGRRGTMAIGGITSMICLFALTQIKTEVQNVAVTGLSYLLVNVYYGVLFAYTPEVIPSAYRGTGAGIAMSLNRLMGLCAGFISYYAGKTTTAPIWICAALFGALGILSLFFPYEPVTSGSA